ncbi:unnamed protein product [Oncorhynchus mykiss]|uniref:DUF4795 domain-containing protein n=1 Tax=Oncorhynchus mykiss TaxID=8022 RepID=A0A060XCK1_ONCMY|nr:unnamed protein product [Oncorhynchus mykiss]
MGGGGHSERSYSQLDGSSGEESFYGQLRCGSFPLEERWWPAPHGLVHLFQHSVFRNAVQKVEEEVLLLKTENTSAKAEQKTKKDRQLQDQSSELMNDVQGAVIQLQAECEKLHGTANHLIEEHSQKQVHIDHLYKSMEELDEKKADKELVEMEFEIKGDKRALETKVSRMQFDSMTEELNTMFQELLSKITGQEQDWHKIIDKISTEMECKLDRIELDPVKKQLEDRWKGIRKQLQAQPAPKEDDAAGIRK